MRALYLLGPILFFMMLPSHVIASQCQAALPDFTGRSAGDPNAPIKVEADFSQYDSGEGAPGRLKLRGNVIVTSGSRVVQAQQAVMDESSQTIRFNGGVTLRQGALKLKTDTAKISMNSDAMEVQDVDYSVDNATVHGKAKSFKRQNDGKVKLKNASYSTCQKEIKENGESTQDWRIEGKEIKLNPQEGYGSVRGMKFYAADFPLMYLPYLSFPLDNRRQSGFLVPNTEFDSENAADIALPYYLNLAENYDATLTARSVSRRGPMVESEFRYLGQASSWQLGAAYLPDDKLDDGQERWLTKISGATRFGKFETLVDYASVSDADFFRDLDASLTVRRTNHLVQRGGLYYNDENFSWQMIVSNYQLIDDSLSETAQPYHTVPNFSLVYDWPLEETDFWANVEMQWVAFNNVRRLDRLASTSLAQQALLDSGAIVEGSRVHVRPAIGYRWSRPWGYVEPSAYFDHTQYRLADQAQGVSDDPSRTLASAAFDTGLIFEKQTKNFIQTIEPRLYYLYRPYKAQNNLPNFDSADTTLSYIQLFSPYRFNSFDRVQDANQLTYAMTYRLLSGKGQQYGYVSLGRTRFFDEQEINLTDTVIDQSHSPWVSEVRWDSSSLGSLFWQAQFESDSWNVRTSQVQWMMLRPWLNVSISHQITVNPRDEFGTKSQNLEQTELAMSLPLGQRWRAYAVWQYDLTTHETQDMLTGVRYQSCCWAVNLFARRAFDKLAVDPIDNSTQRVFDSQIMLQFTLTGLGGVGTKIDQLLTEFLPWQE